MSVKKITFTIKGEPFGKMNMQPLIIGGHARAFNPKKNVEYMERIISILDHTLKKEEEPIFKKEESVTILIVAKFPLTKDCYKKSGQLTKKGYKMINNEIKPTKKPDLDNISKVICDAITKQGKVWVDDSQVTTETLIKKYSLYPCVEVTIVGKDYETK